jgi:hypothetical protein
LGDAQLGHQFSFNNGMKCTLNEFRHVFRYLPIAIIIHPLELADVTVVGFYANLFLARSWQSKSC